MPDCPHCGEYCRPDPKTIVDRYKDPNGRTVFIVVCPSCNGTFDVAAAQFNAEKMRGKVWEEGEKKHKEWEVEEKKKEEVEAEEARKKAEVEAEEKKVSKLGYRWPLHLGRVIGPLIFIIIGIVLSLLLGGGGLSSWLFLIAFAAFAVYLIWPEPLSPIEKRLAKMKKEIEKAKTDAERKKLEAESRIEAVIAQLRQERGGIWGYTGKHAAKYIFRLIGFVSLSFAFMFLPLLKPVGIVVALVAYFMVE